MLTNSLGNLSFAVAMVCLSVSQAVAGIIVPVPYGGGTAIVEGVVSTGNLAVNNSWVLPDFEQGAQSKGIFKTNVSGFESVTTDSTKVIDIERQLFFLESYARNTSDVGVSTNTRVTPTSTFDAAVVGSLATASNAQTILVDFSKSTLSPLDLPRAIGQVFLHGSISAFSSSLGELMNWAADPVASPGVINANTMITIEFGGDFAELTHVLDMSRHDGAVQMAQNGNKLVVGIGGNWIGESTSGHLELTLSLQLTQIPAYELVDPHDPDNVVIDTTPASGGVLSDRFAFYTYSQSLNSESHYTASGISPFGTIFQPYAGFDGRHSMGFAGLQLPDGTTFEQNNIAVYDLNKLSLQPQAVPEPGMIAMALSAGCSLLCWRRRPRSRRAANLSV